MATRAGFLLSNFEAASGATLGHRCASNPSAARIHGNGTTAGGGLGAVSRKNSSTSSSLYWMLHTCTCCFFKGTSGHFWWAFVKCFCLSLSSSVQRKGSTLAFRVPTAMPIHSVCMLQALRLTLIFSFPKGLDFAYSAHCNDNARILQSWASRTRKLTSPFLKTVVSLFLPQSEVITFCSRLYPKSCFQN